VDTTAASEEAVVDITEERRHNAEQVIAQLEQALPPILAQYPVDAAYVYGSVARGTATPLSDVDIALLLADPVSSYDLLKLELAIQGDVETTCGLSSMDVRAINDAPLMVQGRIVQQGRLVYERDHRHRVNFEVLTRKRYFDFAPIAHRLRDAFLERVREDGLLYG
jgi:predicted nucleotidyltransferase